MTPRSAGVPGAPLPAGGAMRVMGSETEYGIHAPSAPGANATMMSARVIQAYAQLTRQRAAGGRKHGGTTRTRNRCMTPGGGRWNATRPTPAN